jgi:hypothetical protein
VSDISLSSDCSVTYAANSQRECRVLPDEAEPGLHEGRERGDVDHPTGSSGRDGALDCCELRRGVAFAQGVEEGVESREGHLTRVSGFGSGKGQGRDKGDPTCWASPAMRSAKRSRRVMLLRWGQDGVGASDGEKWRVTGKVNFKGKVNGRGQGD